LKAWAGWLLAVVCLCLLQGCAQPAHAPTESTVVVAQRHWSGRLALHIAPSHTTSDWAEAQSFSAGFALTGTPEQGELLLFSPLGNTLARLHWLPGEAVLTQGEQQHRAVSLSALVHRLAPEWAGSELPIAALFGWLQGQSVEAAGWQADISSLPQGRLTVTRETPPQQATLRVILD